jgi:hypothetical protein
MGFLDKLFGRGKEKDESEEAKDRISGGDEPPKAPETPPAPEGSEVTQSEQRLDEVRDQAARDEGRMP